METIEKLEDRKSRLIHWIEEVKDSELLDELEYFIRFEAPATGHSWRTPEEEKLLDRHLDWALKRVGKETAVSGNNFKETLQKWREGRSK